MVLKTDFKVSMFNVITLTLTHVNFFSGKLRVERCRKLKVGKMIRIALNIKAA